MPSDSTTLSVDDTTPAPPFGEKPLPGNARIYWLTTAANPRSPATGYDAGRRGWKLHAVIVEAGEDRFADLGITRSLCGRAPPHGWDMDLFVTDPCSACERIASRIGAFQERIGWRLDSELLSVVVVPVEVAS